MFRLKLKSPWILIPRPLIVGCSGLILQRDAFTQSLALVKLSNLRLFWLCFQSFYRDLWPLIKKDNVIKLL